MTTAARYTGTRVQRVEDGRLLQGRGTFVDDITRPGMLHACFVRRSFARAHIRGIDTTAEKIIWSVHDQHTEGRFPNSCLA